MIDECHAVFTYLEGITHDEVWAMPTYRRKYYLIKRYNDIIDSEEQGGVSTVKSGKGRQTSTITGDALKARMKNDTNPL